MKKNFFYWIQDLKMAAILFWDEHLYRYCLTILCALLTIRSLSFALLLPFGICLDILIVRFATYIEFSHMFSKMKQNVHTFKNLEKIDTRMSDCYMKEIRRFKRFKRGNKNGTKIISIYLSKAKNTSDTSYPFYQSESIVLLHSQFNGQEYKDRFLLLHEMCHCIGHSLSGRKVVATRVQVFLLTAFIIAAGMILNSCWIIIMSIFFFTMMALVESPVSVRSRTEAEADVMALTIYKELYGFERMQKIANIFKNRYYLGIYKKNNLAKDVFLLNAILTISKFLSSADKSKFVDKIEDRISFEKEDKNFYSMKLIMSLQGLKFRIKKARLFKSYEFVAVMWDSKLYYISFPLFIMATYTVLTEIVETISITWHYLLLPIVPIFGIVILRRTMAEMYEQKTSFIRNINNNEAN